MTVLEQMLTKYSLNTDADRSRAVREVMQEIALAGLYRGGFFDKAAFYGGTCLRIFHGLPRFSEDLDFSLLESGPGFSFEPYFKAMKEEFSALGFEVEITPKRKTATTNIASAFLKSTSSLYSLQVAGEKAIKIKLEVDTDPPLGFATEEKLLIQPFSFFVKSFSLADLFAGKMHAVLFRKWANRVKGRDWYDFEWYVRKGCELNLAHFCERARQSGHPGLPELKPAEFVTMLQERIRQLEVTSAREDVVRFISDPTPLAIWSQDYFTQLASMLRFKPAVA